MKKTGSRKALDRWAKLIESQDFKSPLRLFGVNVDFVGSKTVFDVGGNKVRTITVVEFGIKLVIVTDVLDHREYDKNKWKD
jgi:mRNA interferase HigB